MLIQEVSGRSNNCGLFALAYAVINTLPPERRRNFHPDLNKLNYSHIRPDALTIYLDHFGSLLRGELRCALSAEMNACYQAALKESMISLCCNDGDVPESLQALADSNEFFIQDVKESIRCSPIPPATLVYAYDLSHYHRATLNLSEGLFRDLETKPVEPEEITQLLDAQLNARNTENLYVICRAYHYLLNTFSENISMLHQANLQKINAIVKEWFLKKLDSLITRDFCNLKKCAEMAECFCLLESGLYEHWVEKFYAQYLISNRWATIYHNYVDYVSTPGVMLSEADLACLAKYWGANLKVEMGGAEATTLVEEFEYEVTLKNLNRLHWVPYINQSIQISFQPVLEIPQNSVASDSNVLRELSQEDESESVSENAENYGQGIYIELLQSKLAEYARKIALNLPSLDDLKAIKPLLDQLNQVASFSELIKILHAFLLRKAKVTPHETLLFEEEILSEDAASGFDALSCNRSTMLEALRTIQNASAQLGDDIYQAFKNEELLPTRAWQDSMLAYESAKFALEQALEKHNQSSKIKIVLGGIEGYTEQILHYFRQHHQDKVVEELERLKTARLKTEEALVVYCHTSAAVEYYFSIYTDSEALSLGSQSAILYARIHQIALCVWQRDPINALDIYLNQEDSAILPNPTKVVHLIHRNRKVRLLKPIETSQQEEMAARHFPCFAELVKLQEQLPKTRQLEWIKDIRYHLKLAILSAMQELNHQKRLKYQLKNQQQEQYQKGQEARAAFEPVFIRILSSYWMLKEADVVLRRRLQACENFQELWACIVQFKFSFPDASDFEMLLSFEDRLPIYTPKQFMALRNMMAAILKPPSLSIQSVGVLEITGHHLVMSDLVAQDTLNNMNVHSIIFALSGTLYFDSNITCFGKSLKVMSQRIEFIQPVLIDVSGFDAARVRCGFIMMSNFPANYDWEQLPKETRARKNYVLALASERLFYIDRHNKKCLAEFDLTEAKYPHRLRNLKKQLGITNLSPPEQAICLFPFLYEQQLNDIQHALHHYPEVEPYQELSASESRVDKTKPQGRSGAQGSHGLSGGNTGSVYIEAGVFVNLNPKMLTVQQRGGFGADGSNGEPGEEGTPGVDGIDGKAGEPSRWRGLAPKGGAFFDKRKSEAVGGGQGGRGGRAGLGGGGGYPGRLILKDSQRVYFDSQAKVEMQAKDLSEPNTPQFTVIREIGQQGEDGVSGEGGHGGKHGMPSVDDGREWTWFRGFWGDGVTVKRGYLKIIEGGWFRAAKLGVIKSEEEIKVDQGYAVSGDKGERLSVYELERALPAEIVEDEEIIISQESINLGEMQEDYGSCVDMSSKVVQRELEECNAMDQHLKALIAEHTQQHVEHQVTHDLLGPSPPRVPLLKLRPTKRLSAENVVASKIDFQEADSPFNLEKLKQQIIDIFSRQYDISIVILVESALELVVEHGENDLRIIHVYYRFIEEIPTKHIPSSQIAWILQNMGLLAQAAVVYESTLTNLSQIEEPFALVDNFCENLFHFCQSAYADSMENLSLVTDTLIVQEIAVSYFRYQFKEKFSNEPQLLALLDKTHFFFDEILLANSQVFTDKKECYLAMLFTIEEVYRYYQKIEREKKEIILDIEAAYYFSMLNITAWKNLEKSSFQLLMNFIQESTFPSKTKKLIFLVGHLELSREELKALRLCQQLDASVSELVLSRLFDNLLQENRELVQHATPLTREIANTLLELLSQQPHQEDVFYHEELFACLKTANQEGLLKLKTKIVVAKSQIVVSESCAGDVRSMIDLFNSHVNFSSEVGPIAEQLVLIKRLLMVLAAHVDRLSEADLLECSHKINFRLIQLQSGLKSYDVNHACHLNPLYRAIFFFKMKTEQLGDVSLSNHLCDDMVDFVLTQYKALVESIVSKKQLMVSQCDQGYEDKIHEVMELIRAKDVGQKIPEQCFNVIKMHLEQMNFWFSSTYSDLNGNRRKKFFEALTTYLASVGSYLRRKITPTSYIEGIDKEICVLIYKYFHEDHESIKENNALKVSSDSRANTYLWDFGNSFSFLDLVKIFAVLLKNVGDEDFVVADFLENMHFLLRYTDKLLISYSKEPHEEVIGFMQRIDQLLETYPFFKTWYENELIGLAQFKRTIEASLDSDEAYRSLLEEKKSFALGAEEKIKQLTTTFYEDLANALCQQALFLTIGFKEFVVEQNAFFDASSGLNLEKFIFDTLEGEALESWMTWSLGEYRQRLSQISHQIYKQAGLTTVATVCPEVGKMARVSDDCIAYYAHLLAVKRYVIEHGKSIDIESCYIVISFLLGEFQTDGGNFTDEDLKSIFLEITELVEFMQRLELAELIPSINKLVELMEGVLLTEQDILLCRQADVVEEENAAQIFDQLNKAVEFYSDRVIGLKKLQEYLVTPNLKIAKELLENYAKDFLKILKVSGHITECSISAYVTFLCNELREYDEEVCVNLISQCVHLLSCFQWISEELLLTLERLTRLENELGAKKKAQNILRDFIKNQLYSVYAPKLKDTDRQFLKRLLASADISTRKCLSFLEGVEKCSESLELLGQHYLCFFAKMEDLESFKPSPEDLLKHLKPVMDEKEFILLREAMAYAAKDDKNSPQRLQEILKIIIFMKPDDWRYHFQQWVVNVIYQSLLTSCQFDLMQHIVYPLEEMIAALPLLLKTLSICAPDFIENLINYLSIYEHSEKQTKAILGAIDFSFRHFGAEAQLKLIEIKSTLVSLIQLKYFFDRFIAFSNLSKNWFEFFNLLSVKFNVDVKWGGSQEERIRVVAEILAEVANFSDLTEIMGILKTARAKSWLQRIYDYKFSQELQKFFLDLPPGMLTEALKNGIYEKLESVKKNVPILRMLAARLQQENKLMAVATRLSPQELLVIFQLLERCVVTDELIENLQGTGLPQWRSELRAHQMLQELKKHADPEIVQSCLNNLLQLQAKIGEKLIDQVRAILDKHEKINLVRLEEFLKQLVQGHWVLTEKILKALENAPLIEWGNICEAHTNRGDLTLSEIIEYLKVEFDETSTTPIIFIPESPLENNAKLEKVLAYEVNAIKAVFDTAILVSNDEEKKLAEWSLQDIEKWSQYIRENHTPLEVWIKENLHVVLAVIGKAASLLEEPAKKFQVRDTQYLAVLLFLHARMINKSRLGQISTGEGKTLATVMLAIVNVLLGFQVDIFTSSSVLAIRDAKINKKLYRLFGITVANNCDEKCQKDERTRQKRYRHHVVYGHLESFQPDVLLTDFLKRRTLGDRVCRNVDPISQRKAVALLDEVDSMLIDRLDYVLYLSHNIPELRYLTRIYIEIWLYVNSQPIEESQINQAVLQISEIIERRIHQGEIEVPTYLKDFVQYRLSIWIKMAIDSLHMEKDDSFILQPSSAMEGDSNKIVVVEKGTGVEQKQLQWNNGLHQFLQLRYLQKVMIESLEAIFISSLTFFERYENSMYGSTGTLGSDANREMLKKIYNVDLFHLPRFRLSRYREEEGVIICEPTVWIDEIFLEVQQKMNKDRAVLVICENILTVNKLHKHFLENQEALLRSDKKTKAIIYEYKSAFVPFTIGQDDSRLQSGDIIIATNLAGRGTDLKISAELEACGGLHVVLTYMPEGVRIPEQAQRRAGRQGQPGSGKFIVCAPPEYKDTPFVEFCQMHEDAERQKMEYVRTVNIPMIMIKRRLLETKFSVLFSEVKKILEKKLYSEKYIEIQLKSLTDHWAIWLDSISQKITNLNPSSEALLFSEFDHFQSDMLAMVNEENIIKLVRSSHELIKLGYYCLINKKYGLARTCFDYLIKEDPAHAAMAYYYKPHCLLEGKKITTVMQKRKIKTWLRKARQLMNVRVNELQAQNQMLKHVADVRRLKGQGDFANEFEMQIKNECDLLGTHIQTIDQAIGSELSAEVLNSVLPQSEAELVYKEIFEHSSIIQPARLSKKAKVVDGRLWLMDSKKRKLELEIPLPSKHDYCEREILDFIATKSKNADTLSIKVKDLEEAEIFQTATDFWQHLIEHHLVENNHEVYVIASDQESLNKLDLSFLASYEKSIRAKLIQHCNEVFCQKLFEEELTGLIKTGATDAFERLEQLLLAHPSQLKRTFQGDLRIEVAYGQVVNLPRELEKFRGVIADLIQPELSKKQGEPKPPFTVLLTSVRLTEQVNEAALQLWEYLLQHRVIKPPRLNWRLADSNTKDSIKKVEEKLKQALSEKLDEFFKRMEKEKHLKYLGYAGKGYIREEVAKSDEDIYKLFGLTTAQEVSERLCAQCEQLVNTGYRVELCYQVTPVDSDIQLNVAYVYLCGATIQFKAINPLGFIECKELGKDDLGKSYDKIRTCLSGSASKFLERKDEKKLSKVLADSGCPSRFLVTAIQDALLMDEKFFNELQKRGIIESTRKYEDMLADLEFYIVNPDIIRAYLDFALQKKQINNGFPHPAILQALAYLVGTQFRLWECPLSFRNVFYFEQYKKIRVHKNFLPYMPPNTKKRLEVLQTNETEYAPLHLVGCGEVVASTEDVFPLDLEKARKEYIERVFNKLKEVIGSFKSYAALTVGLKPLATFFERGHYPIELMLFQQINYDQVLVFEEYISPWNWGAFAVALLGLAQITAGVMLEVCTLGLGTPIAIGLISEGISDLLFAVQAGLSKEFSWKSYAIHKAVSLTITTLTVGFSFLRNAAEAVEIVARTGFQIFKMAVGRTLIEMAQSSIFWIGNIVIDFLLKNLPSAILDLMGPFIRNRIHASESVRASVEALRANLEILLMSRYDRAFVEKEIREALETVRHTQTGSQSMLLAVGTHLAYEVPALINLATKRFSSNERSIKIIGQVTEAVKYFLPLLKTPSILSLIENRFNDVNGIVGPRAAVFRDDASSVTSLSNDDRAWINAELMKLQEDFTQEMLERVNQELITPTVGRAVQSAIGYLCQKVTRKLRDKFNGKKTNSGMDKIAEESKKIDEAHAVESAEMHATPSVTVDSDTLSSGIVSVGDLDPNTPVINADGASLKEVVGAAGGEEVKVFKNANGEVVVVQGESSKWAQQKPPTPAEIKAKRHRNKVFAIGLAKVTTRLALKIVSTAAKIASENKVRYYGHAVQAMELEVLKQKLASLKQIQKIEDSATEMQAELTQRGGAVYQQLAAKDLERLIELKELELAHSEEKIKSTLLKELENFVSQNADNEHGLQFFAEQIKAIAEIGRYVTVGRDKLEATLESIFAHYEKYLGEKMPEELPQLRNISRTMQQQMDSQLLDAEEQIEVLKQAQEMLQQEGRVKDLMQVADRYESFAEYNVRSTLHTMEGFMHRNWHPVRPHRDRHRNSRIEEVDATGSAISSSSSSTQAAPPSSGLLGGSSSGASGSGAAVGGEEGSEKEKSGEVAKKSSSSNGLGEAGFEFGGRALGSFADMVKADATVNASKYGAEAEKHKADGVKAQAQADVAIVLIDSNAELQKQTLDYNAKVADAATTSQQNAQQHAEKMKNLHVSAATSAAQDAREDLATAHTHEDFLRGNPDFRELFLESMRDTVGAKVKHNAAATAPEEAKSPLTQPLTFEMLDPQAQRVQLPGGTKFFAALQAAGNPRPADAMEVNPPAPARLGAAAPQAQQPGAPQPPVARPPAAGPG